MRRTLLIAPNLIDPAGEQSLVGSSLRRFEDSSRVTLLHWLSLNPIPEVEWFGIRSGFHSISEGGLVVSGLGASPPHNAICFRVDLMSLDTDNLVGSSGGLSEAEGYDVGKALSRLNTRSLTLVAGPLSEHGLVWEPKSTFHLECQPPREALGNPIKGMLPEGEGEGELRRFIDDGVNLLSDLELNRRRLDEGKPPLNLAWPWGNGLVGDLPNVSLKLMEPVAFYGTSLRMRGLCRLSGVRFLDTNLGFKSDWPSMLELPSVAVLHTSAFEEARRASRLEVAEELWLQIEAEWLTPLAERGRSAEDERWRLAVLAPNLEGKGLCWTLESHGGSPNGVPFHEKVLGDPRVPASTLWQTVLESLSPS